MLQIIKKILFHHLIWQCHSINWLLSCYVRVVETETWEQYHGYYLAFWGCLLILYLKLPLYYQQNIHPGKHCSSAFIKRHYFKPLINYFQNQTILHLFILELRYLLINNLCSTTLVTILFETQWKTQTLKITHVFLNKGDACL